jgi:carbon storage regulator
MLVLSRGIGESVVIGDGTVIVTVLKVSGKQVRIGIAAPRDVRIEREEVHLQRHGEEVAEARSV